MNDNESFKWYKLAAGQGDPDAQYNTGLCYELGIGTEVDLKKAVKWYEESAEQGNDDAREALEKLGVSSDTSR